MGCLSVFLDEQDAKNLINWLNQEQEIAFIVADGLNRWKAVSTVASLEDGEHSLWHVPGGELTLWGACDFEEIIADPWNGWTTEPRTRAFPNIPLLVQPYFEVAHPAVIWLDLRTRHRPYSQQERNELRVLNASLLRDTDYMMVSDFQWIGNHYQPAPQQTHQWWKRLKKWVEREAVRLRQFNDAKGKFDRWSFWAFPSAFQKLKDEG